MEAITLEIQNTKQSTKNNVSKEDNKNRGQK